MKKYLLTSLFSVIITLGITAQEKSATPLLRYEENHSLTWEEAISFYTDLDRRYPEARLIEMGMTDAGRPLHLFIISGDGEFEPETIRSKGKSHRAHQQRDTPWRA